MSDDNRRSRIVLLSLVGVVALVVVIALVAVFTRGGSPSFDPESPEGVVQRYTAAVIDGDAATAADLLEPDLAASCDPVPPPSEDRRVTLLRTTERDDTARVEVLIATVYGSGPLGTSEYESEGEFDLVRISDRWYLTQVPWEFAVCTESGL